MNKNSYNKNIFLETSRTYLRPFQQNELNMFITWVLEGDGLLDVMSDGYDLNELQEWFLKLTSHWEQHQFGKVPVFLKDNDEFIGYAGFTIAGPETSEKNRLAPNPNGSPNLEIGYRLHKKFWGKGYATELAVAILQKIIEKFPGVPKVFALARDDNFASQNVLHKCMFKHLSTQVYSWGDKRWGFFYTTNDNIKKLLAQKSLAEKFKKQPNE